jgi:hypothetical protein
MFDVSPSLRWKMDNAVLLLAASAVVVGLLFNNGEMRLLEEVEVRKAETTVEKTTIAATTDTMATVR